MLFSSTEEYVGCEITITVKDPDRISYFKVKGILDNFDYKKWKVVD